MSKSPIICIVDDEATLREVVRRYLEHDGFQVIEAETGPQALQLLREQPADLILLDIMLPGLDGFTLMRVLRHGSEVTEPHAGGGIPIIALTSRSSEADRIEGFALGVDDYVLKPFSPRELVARVKAVLRRARPGTTEDTPRPLVYGPLCIDPLQRRVSIHERAITLTAREFDLLWLLASYPRQVFTRDQLLDRVWGQEYYGDDSTVTVHIRRMREKLEADPSSPQYVQTVWGVGYKFEPQEGDS
ncbi:MAG: response regulator transcription factor [Pleurocapsa minor GSE-CHR-MK-17-07R]|jgi:DNA-binding response OmpR family regulator|nr:response regulator transcription factor [Pleurocapsa minor GSE-CHR-MK 17-07R]